MRTVAEKFPVDESSRISEPEIPQPGEVLTEEQLWFGAKVPEDQPSQAGVDFEHCAHEFLIDSIAFYKRIGSNVNNACGPLVTMATKSFQEVIDEIKREVAQLPKWEQEYLGYDPETE